MSLNMSDAGGILLTILVISSLCAICATDQCSKWPCINGGECIPSGEDDYMCSCVLGWSGKNCEINDDDCKENKCQNGGICVDDPNVRYKCNCTNKFVGRYCNFPNPCFPNHKCMNGATCIPYENGEFMCKCNNNFMGNLCENLTWTCPDDINENRGMCNYHGECGYDSKGAFECKCYDEYSGDLCEIKSKYKIDIGCTKKKCLNGGICKVQENGISHCKCLKDFDGENCEVPVTIPIGTRRRKEHIDSPAKVTAQPRIMASNKADFVCSVECQALRGNGICEQHCNIDICQYDGGDCDPWKKCKHKRVSHCRSVFRDGKCDPECNSVDCLFDGQDCDKNTENIVYSHDILADLLDWFMFIKMMTYDKEVCSDIFTLSFNLDKIGDKDEMNLVYVFDAKDN